MLAIIDGSEADIKVRVKAEIVKQMEEEKILLSAMKKLEEKQLRIERITLLKKILKKKMTASKLRETIRMMHLMTLEDLEMEVDMVLEQAQGMMETEASYPDCDHDCKEEDAMDQGGGDDLHVQVETGVQGVPQMAVNEEIVTKLNLESEVVTEVSTCTGDKKNINLKNIHVTSGKLGRLENFTTSTSGTNILTSGNNSELLNHPNHWGQIRKRARESDIDDGRGLCMRKRWRGPSLGK